MSLNAGGRIVLLCEDGELYVRLLALVDGRPTYLIPRLPVAAEALKLLSEPAPFCVTLDAVTVSANAETIAVRFENRTMWGGRERFRLAVREVLAARVLFRGISD